MTPHAPAPWSVVPQHDAVPYLTIKATSGRTVARVWHRPGTLRPRGADTARADAQLIVAAPALLAALRLAQPCLAADLTSWVQCNSLAHDWQIGQPLPPMDDAAALEVVLGLVAAHQVATAALAMVDA